MSTLWTRFNRICLIGVFLLSVGIVDAQNQKLDAINCALTPDQIVGQAFSGTAGASGETSDSGLTPEGENIDTSDLTEEEREKLLKYRRELYRERRYKNESV